jgi:hypothetical protein
MKSVATPLTQIGPKIAWKSIFKVIPSILYIIYDKIFLLNLWKNFIVLRNKAIVPT